MPRFVGPGEIEVATHSQARHLSAETIVIGTGSRPRSPSAFLVDDQFVLDADSYERVAGAARVAIVGAGPIGLFAIYLARKMGATRVIAIDINKFRLDLALQLGADTVFDPQQSNVPEEILALTDGDGVGRIIDAAGANESLSESFSYLRKGGRLILVGNPKQDLVIKSPMVSLVQKEITIKGVHGRRMYDTWEKTQTFLLEKTLPLELFVSHEFAMTDYDKAFAEIDSGRTSKVMLRNKHE